MRATLHSLLGHKSNSVQHVYHLRLYHYQLGPRVRVEDGGTVRLASANV